MAGDFEVRIDPAEFARLVRDVREFSPELSKALRRRLRAAADPATADVKRRLMARTFHVNAGLARGLAAGTKVSIRTGARTAGISIVTTGTKLPPGKQAMVRAYNKPTFKHPVFGNRRVFVIQRGRPYFDEVLEPHKRSMLTGADKALRDAAATIHAGEAHE